MIISPTAAATLLYLAFTITPAAADAPPTTPLVPPFEPPDNLHYSQPHSFRGVQDGGRVPHFQISGHSTGLPGVHDYLRLVPPNPLAYGSIFTQEPLQAAEWVAEIAFRVHGPPPVGIPDAGEERKPPKGGRGLAFWFTKTANSSPVTIAPNVHALVASPPPAVPEPNDPSDPSVSLFGYSTTFDGLGVIFDTSPNTPLFPRSDPHSYADDVHGVGASGVVSGILDDGSGGWLEKKGRVLKEGEEAGYLDRAAGECEAAFRNAQGLLWARISYVKQTIRVDLDLSPHTTLAKAGRDYAHNCFILPGIRLSPGSFLGISGLAGGNAEPDSVDVYAMDVFEVVPQEPGQKPTTDTEEPPEEREDHPLEGTSQDAVLSLSHEIFLSQAKMVEAIDALARRVDNLGRSVMMNKGNANMPGRDSGPQSPMGSPMMMNRLSTLEAKLDQVLAASNGDNSNGGSSPSDADTVKHILQLQDRLMVELKAFGRKLDAANGQSTASLATLSSHSAESLQLLQQSTTALDKATSQGLGWPFWILLVGVVGWIGGGLVRRGGEGGFLPGDFGRSKKNF